jgi:hypothetical protein
MGAENFQSALGELNELLGQFKKEMSQKSYPLEPALARLFVSRVVQAADEGPRLLEVEFSGRATALTPTRPRDEAVLMQALEQDLDREENVGLRWLVVSYWPYCAMETQSSGTSKH